MQEVRLRSHMSKQNTEKLFKKRALNQADVPWKNTVRNDEIADGIRKHNHKKPN